MSLSAHSATCRFGDGAELGPFDIDVAPGAVTALVGPSGSGKSTITRLLAGLVEPARGDVTCDGAPVRTVRRRLPGHTALMSQHPLAAADPRMTLRAAIASTAPRRRGDEAPVDVMALARTVGLEIDLLDRLPAEVSGGQLQRAMLARALAQRPRYLLADEATAHLDPITAAAVAGVLRQEADQGVGVLVVTHDHALADTIADTRVDLGP